MEKVKKNLDAEARRYIAGLGGTAKAAISAGLPKVMHKGHLVFGDVEIPCAVIEGKIRVLTANGLSGIFLAGKPNQRMLAKKEVISVGNEDAELPYFMARKAIIPFISIIFPLKPFCQIASYVKKKTLCFIFLDIMILNKFFQWKFFQFFYQKHFC